MQRYVKSGVEEEHEHVCWPWEAWCCDKFRVVTVAITFKVLRLFTKSNLTLDINRVFFIHVTNMIGTTVRGYRDGLLKIWVVEKLLLKFFAISFVFSNWLLF